MKKPVTKTLIKKILRITGITAILLILLAEISLRIFFSEQLKTREYPRIYVSDSLTGYRYIPGIQGNICTPSISKSFKINNQGYYGNDFSLHTKPGMFRIAIVGASDAAGIWMNGYENFSMKLEKLFHQNGYRNIEVVNFAVDGKMRNVYNIRLIQREIVNYEPDLLLLNADMPFIHGEYRREVYKNYVLIYNGLSEQSKKWCQAKIDYITDHKFLTFFYKASYIVRAACRYYTQNYSNNNSFNLEVFIEKKIQAPDISYFPYSVKKSVDMLTATRDSLSAHNCKLVLFDYERSTYHETIFTKYKLDNFFLNVRSTPDLVHKHDSHYNEEGHAVIALQLFEKLLVKNYIPQKQ